MKTHQIIERIRQEVGETSVAAFANALGVTAQIVYYWLKGNMPSYPYLQKLSKHWMVTIEIEPNGG
jgi:DNA-binding transcriptional regulator YiaG